ncbi:MAG: tetratricopeptide repeat protein, partial [Pseudomonadota bacterium]|nr:tetratricopeptide repeat protein [Pseudomonadota bacterium]
RRGASTRSPQMLMADGVANVLRELGDDALSQSQLLRVLGEAQLNLGEIGAAHATLDIAAARVANTGDRLLAAEIDAVRADLALREMRQDDADKLFDSALATTVTVRGAHSLETARIKARRAISLVSLGRFEDARASATEAHLVLSAMLGATAPETLSALLARATIEEQVRDDAAAMVTLHDYIAAVESSFGERDARLIYALRSLGEVLRRRRDFDGGRAAFGRGVEIARAQFGARHVQVASILTRWATLERDAGDPQTAISILDQAEAALPEGEIAGRAQLLATRGGTWIVLGDALRAEPDLREALRLRRDSGGLRTGLAWFSQAQLGEALALQGKISEAQTLQSEAARELRTLLGPDAYQNALIAQRWAQTLDLQHDWRGAVTQWREALRVFEKTYGRDHFMYFDWSLSLADSLSHVDDGRAEAAQISDDLIARWSGNPEIVERYSSLILLRCRLHIDTGAIAAANSLAQRALARPDLQASVEERAALEGFAHPQ